MFLVSTRPDRAGSTRFATSRRGLNEDRKEVVLSALLLQACTQAAIAECRVPTEPDISFLPRTTEPKVLMPWGTGINCQIYQWAWQNFLFVTQSDGTGATFLNYPTFEDAFKIKASPLFPDKMHGSLSLAPRDSKSPKDIGVIEHQRALPRHVLIDQAGNPIWYAIHVNDKYIQFLRDYRLTDPTVLGSLRPLTDLAFRPGVVELKSAWKIVDGTNAPKNYITSKARIPVFKNDNGTIVTDGRDVTVALLALRVAGVIEGHPEFIWATFEHVNHETNGDWRRRGAGRQQQSRSSTYSCGNANGQLYTLSGGPELAVCTSCRRS
jgi:hypothetical protein